MKKFCVKCGHRIKGRRKQSFCDDCLKKMYQAFIKKQKNMFKNQETSPETDTQEERDEKTPQEDTAPEQTEESSENEEESEEDVDTKDE